MKKSLFTSLLVIAMGFFVKPNMVFAQVSTIEEALLTQFDRGKMLLHGFKNDSAIVIFDSIHIQLEEREALETPFGLRVQFRLAEAYEKDERDEEAIKLLLLLKEKSYSQKIWDVHANVCITLARQYEKFKEAEECIQHLRLAKRIIDKEQLDTIYPLFAVRIASYNRMFADKDSTLYYATEAIRSGAKYGQVSEEADGHLVKGHVHRQKGQENLSIPHYRKALVLYRSLENFTSMSYMYASLASIYKNRGHLDTALLYNDSTMLATKAAIKEGYKSRYMISVSHLERSRFYQSLGMLDSALYFQKLGYEERIAFISSRNAAQVREIEEQYVDEKKALQIEEQAAEIRQERARRYQLIGFVILILIFLVLLMYYNQRLQNAKRKTEEQASLISQQNEDLQQSLSQQLVLQGEVHHRVKNNLQVIVSLLELQQEDIIDPLAQKKLETMSNRIYSMAAIHEILYQQEDKTQVKFDEYIHNLCLHFSNFSLEEDKPTYQIDVEQHEFNLATSMPLGIILTELLTNSLKYARGAGRKLEISIKLQKEADIYSLTYHDNGPGFPNGQLVEREGGLGTYLLRSMVRQLKGEMKTSNQAGANYQIYFSERNS